MSDGRKYELGDKVKFTDDDGNQADGVVHGVRYQQGRYELVGAYYEDNDKSKPPIPGTGHMELVKGTEGEKHSFEYIIVHADQHKNWGETEKANNANIKAEKHHLVKPHPELKQYIRVFED